MSFRAMAGRGTANSMRFGNVTASAVALMVAGLLASRDLSAQVLRRAYCNITSVKAERLTNAVQVTIRADGLMAPDIQSRELFNTDAARMGRRDKMGKRISAIPIRIWNARSQVGSIVQVGVYPVSHVEVTIPPEAAEGIGVLLRIVLYKPAVTREVRLPGDRWTFDARNESPPFISIEQSQDRRSLIIIVTSDRRAIEPPTRRKPRDPTTSQLEVAMRDGLLSVYAVDRDLRDVLREIGRVGGQSITAAASLERCVNLSLDGVSLEHTLECVGMAYGVSVTRTNDGWYLSDASVSDPSAYAGSTFAVVPLRYISASAARDILPDTLLQHVQIDAQHNALTVVGSPELIEKVRRDVGAVDRPVPLIELTATVVEFRSSNDLNAALGAALQWLRGEASADTAGDFLFSTVGGNSDDLQMRLRALTSRGRASVRAESRTTVLNGNSGRLFAGSEKRTTAQYYDFFSDRLETRILTVRSGISLEVTPWTAGSGTVTARVRAEVSDIAERERVTGNPTISTRMAETTVRIRDGDTLMIGGLDMKERMRSDLGPGGLPATFPSTMRIQDTRLAVFVTARTLGGSVTDVRADLGQSK